MEFGRYLDWGLLCWAFLDIKGRLGVFLKKCLFGGVINLIAGLIIANTFPPLEYPHILLLLLLMLLNLIELHFLLLFHCIAAAGKSLLLVFQHFDYFVIEVLSVFIDSLVEDDQFLVLDVVGLGLAIGLVRRHLVGFVLLVRWERLDGHGWMGVLFRWFVWVYFGYLLYCCE